MCKSYIAPARFNLVLVLMLGVFLAIILRLLYLHVWNQDELLAIVEKNRHKFEVISACRGNIVDRSGNLLATTRGLIELGVDPQAISEDDRHKWPALSKLINLDLAEIENKFMTKTRKVKGKDIRLIRWKKLASGLHDDLYAQVKALKIKGVYGNRKYERLYPQNQLASHVLGFVNKEGLAVTGVERYMDFYLKGQDGWIESERDGRSRELAQYRSREIDPIDGVNVQLTLDLTVQAVIENELKELVQDKSPKAATIIVSDPSTGYILGLANYPTYDPNRFWKFSLDNHRNRAVTDIYEPGSPFKAITMAAAMNESLVDLDETYDCTISRIQHNGKVVQLPKDHRPFDILSARDVIRKSSNRGIAQIAMRLGEEKLYDYAQAFGFGQRAGYGPGGEVSGILHPTKDWDRLTITRMPMGHSISCTPMQMHCAMSALANGGVLMEPQVVSQIFDHNGNPVESYTPKAVRRVISADTASKMAQLLTEVTGQHGTSTKAAIEGYEVAGKSGTSQKIIHGRYSKSHHVGSFSGFFPATNPRVVITVVVDDAQVNGVAWGGKVAAPSFKSVGERLISHLNIRPDTLNNNTMLALKGH